MLAHGVIGDMRLSTLSTYCVMLHLFTGADAAPAPTTNQTITSRSAHGPFGTTDFKGVGPPPGQQHLTMRISNTHHASISLDFSTSVDATKPTAEDAAGSNAVAPGSTSVIYLPLDWVGQIRVQWADSSFAAASKIEGHHALENGVPKTYIDVSYVDGYTFPVTCRAIPRGEIDEVVLTGCNKPLELLGNPFPDQLGIDDDGNIEVYINPAQTTDAHVPTPFFAPCAGAAYTFPKDDGANRGVEMDSVDCCVGAVCPAPERQT